MAAVVGLVSLAGSAQAFTILIDPCGGGCDAPTTAEEGARWTAAPGAAAGLADGISVGVAPGFVEALAFAPELIEPGRRAVLDAFAAWQTPEVRFDIQLDAPATDDFEIFVDAVPGDHPAFAGTTFTAIAIVDADFNSFLTLTNGQEVFSDVITSGEILVNYDIFGILFGALVAGGAVEPADLPSHVQQTVMHEIGHVLGLGHPNQSPELNLDTDLDPFNQPRIDPRDPFADMIFSPNVYPNTLMWGGIPTDVEWFGRAELSADERLGRDVLYPSLVPEPTTLVLLSCCVGAVVATRPRVKPVGDSQHVGSR